METIAQDLIREHPSSNEGVGVNVLPLREELVGNVRSELWILFGAVGLVLLMVCANIANLLLVRGSTRERELKLRVVLGAARIRILRQLFTENVLLALLGGCAGIVFAFLGVRALQGARAFQTLGPSGLPSVGEFGIGTPVVAFDLVISVFSGLAFAFAPVWQVMRCNANHELKDGVRASDPASRLNLRDILVVAETALGVMVVIGAALLLRSFLLLEQVPLGFDPKGLLTLRVIPRSPEYAEPRHRTSFYHEALERIHEVPGVKAAGAVSFLPLTYFRASKGFSFEGQPTLNSRELPMASYDLVSPGYFATMSIPFLEGRDFSWSDTPETAPVIVINEALAQRYWPNEDPIGRRIKAGRPDQTIPWLTVVGVVGNFRDFDVASQPQPTIFFPISQSQGGAGLLRDWVVRTKGDPLAAAAGVRQAIWSLDKGMPVSRVQRMESVRAASVAQQQFTLLLLALFAGLALLLASVGQYGVTAYAARQRTREIGIRLALGAQRRDVMRLILFHGASIGLVGLGLGIGAALSLAHLMTALLYGVRPTDPFAFGAVAVLLIFLTLIACYIPARRAMHTDPMVALRHE
jgi:putative ABC transport system permease protein